MYRMTFSSVLSKLIKIFDGYERGEDITRKNLANNFVKNIHDRYIGQLWKHFSFIYFYIWSVERIKPEMYVYSYSQYSTGRQGAVQPLICSHFSLFFCSNICANLYKFDLRNTRFQVIYHVQTFNMTLNSK